MLVIPAMDIIDSEVVRLTQGDYNRKTVYSDDPLETAKRFQQAGVKKIHLVDLSGAKLGSPVHASLFGQIRTQTGVAIEAGGGVRFLADVDALFEAGLQLDTDQVMIGSLPFKNREEFVLIQKKYAAQILLTVDVWDREVKISGWQEETGQDIFSFIQEMKDSGITSFLITQIKRDGMLNGPDIELYQEIDDRFTDISVTVSGGVSSVKDMTDFPKMKTVTGIILGRAFYENHVTLDDIKNIS
ncbi:MAG: HisA/HisF-related TIM barrel protein [Leptospirales bacterium]